LVTLRRAAVVEREGFTLTASPPGRTLWHHRQGQDREEVSMPFAGLGLHVVVALICAIHVVRTRQQMYWLFILFAFPLLGSAVYFFAVFLPNSRLERGAIRAMTAAAKAIDPTREVREAQAAFDDAPTAQNQMRLAAALLEIGEAEQAARQYEACMKGPFASDLEIRFGAAKAFAQCQRYSVAHAYLQGIRTERPDYRPEGVTLLIARCLAGMGRAQEARAEFESAVSRFGTFESKAEYAIFALVTGDNPTAQRLDIELKKISQRWNSLTRDLNEAVARRYAAAKSIAKQGV
jgi:hypothetical protein